MIKGFSLDGLQPPAGVDCLKNIVFMVRGVSHNLNCPLQGLGSVQVLKMCQIAASYLLSTVNDTLQYDFVIVSGSSISCVNWGEYSFVNQITSSPDGQSPPIGRFIPFRDEPSEDGVTKKTSIVCIQYWWSGSQRWVLTCCLLSVRKAVIHLPVKSGTHGWKTLYDCIVSRAEIQKHDPA